MDKLIALLDKLARPLADKAGLPIDKARHVVAGAAVALVFLPLGPWFASVAVSAAAVGREAWNRLNGGEFSWADIGATAAGGYPLAALGFLV